MEIRKKSDRELTKLLAEKREYLRDLNFKVSSRQHKNYKELCKVKKEIAVILTVMNERRLLKELKSKSIVPVKSAAMSAKKLTK